MDYNYLVNLLVCTCPSCRCLILDGISASLHTSELQSIDGLGCTILSRNGCYLYRSCREVRRSIGSDIGSLYLNDNVVYIGNSLGLRYLVNYYIYGWGVDKDPGKALELLDRYSESGNDDVSSLYGNYYYSLKDYDKAAEYYTTAADSGDAAAMRQLGQIYKQKNDYKTSLEWYEKSAEAGDPDGAREAGEYNLYGFTGEVDYEKAYDYFIKAAELYKEKNYSRSLYPLVLRHLGDMYSQGQGVETDPDKAAEYYALADEAEAAQG